jgi:hypothetical protein
MSSFASDVRDSHAFVIARQDTLDAIEQMKRAVGNMQSTVNGLPVAGRYATAWRSAVAAFNTVAEATKKNADELAEAVLVHGRNTDTANDSGQEIFNKLANQAQAGLV